MSIREYKNTNEIAVIRIFFCDIYKISSNLSNLLFSSNSLRIDLLNSLNNNLFYNNTEGYRIYISKAINIRSVNLLANRIILSTKL